MKKILFFAAAVAALLTSCQKEKVSDDSSAKGVKTITASISNSTKVVMGEDDGTETKLNWELGDNLFLMDQNGSTGKYSSLNAGETATFNLIDGDGVSPEGQHVAAYPYERITIDTSDGYPTILFKYCDSQTYTENSFDKNAMPLLAMNETGTNFSFNAMAPVLRFNVKLATAISDVKVKSVIIESASRNLSGFSNWDGSCFYEPGESYGEVGPSITLNCGEGVPISTTATQFCMVIPANEDDVEGDIYPSGDLTITVKTNKGDIVRTSKAAATFVAGKVYNINVSGDPVMGIPIVGSLSNLGPVKETIVSGSALDDPEGTTSFCAPFDVEVPAGAQAFAMFYDAENNVIHSVYTGSSIPASMPVIIIASESDLSEDDVNLADVPSTWTNVLVGNLSQTTTVQNNYVLAVKNGVVGFYKVDSYELGVNKAYMVLP